MVRPVDGVIQHWSLDAECIRVTVDPGLLEREMTVFDSITRATLGWRDLSCNRLCQLEPELSVDPVDTGCFASSNCEPRIHWRSMAPDEASPEVTFASDPCSGRIHAASIQFGRSFLTDGPGIMALAGRAIGLQHAESVPSVLGEHAGIMPGDTEAICTLYGTPAWCEAP